MAAGDPGTLKRNYSATAVETTLTAAISSQASGDSNTSFVVASVSGFPSTFPYTLLVDPDTNKEEVLTVYGGAGTSLQVYRGQDGTSAPAHSAGATVRHGVSAREFKELQTHIAARGFASDSGILSGVDTHVHGIITGEGDVVGTLKTQTLTNKTLTSPTINTPTVSALTLSDASIIFEGATADAFETTLTVTDPTADRTLTLPNATDTLVVRATTDTLTNKTLTSPTINGGTISTATVTSATIVSGTLSTDLAAGGFKVTGLGTPSSTADAATKGYVDTQVSNLVASAPATLDTLNELAAALGNDANYATTITNALAAKLSLTGGTMTGAIAMGTSKITGLGTPTASTDATTKGYVDGILGSATAAEASALAAATSATSASASASAAASSASAAATSATAGAASASAAATSASSSLTSQTAAATSATSAAASASAASASQTAAATSATSAATSASSAATSATASASSATAASGSSSAAAVSAASSATSATAAATSETNAAASAASAATTYDNFDDRYLGAKTTAPTVDNDGNALITGALYFNSVSGIMGVWSGSAWVAINTTSTYSAPTIGSTLISSGTTITTLNGVVDIVLNGPGSITDELTLLLMEAI
jgi:hypothetical protein